MSSQSSFFMHLFNIRPSGHGVPSLLMALCLASGSGHAAGVWELRNPANASLENSVWLDASAQAASTFRSVKNGSEDLWTDIAPRNGKNYELVMARSEVGFSKDGWALGFGVRQQALGQADKDTLTVYRAQVLGLPLTAGQTYGLSYQLDGLEAQALSLGRAFQWQTSGHQWRWGASVSALNAKRFKSQTAQGQATVQNGGALEVNGSTVNDDSAINTVASGFIPRFHNQTPSGEGYAMDLGVHYISPQGLELEWTVADAFSEIQWKQVPEVTLNGSSTFNGQFPGGRKVLINFMQTLAPMHQITGRLPLGPWTVQASGTVIGPLSLFSAGVQRAVGGQWVAAADYDFFFNTVGVSLSHPWVSVALHTDELQLEKARALSLQISTRIRF